MQKPGQLSYLVVRYLFMEATPREKMQLEEWASLSTKNRVWLDRFRNIEWLEYRIRRYRRPDHEEGRIQMWKMINIAKAKKAKRKKKIRRLLWCVLLLALAAAIIFYRLFSGS
jgi:hypothetical protein